MHDDASRAVTPPSAAPRETAADTLAWFKSAPAKETEGLKIDLERDARVLREWKARR